MAFLSAAAPFSAYRAGRTDEAIAYAEQVLVRDPNAAEAHMCLALIRMRRQDMAGMVESLRKCAQARSGEWILEQIHADFEKMGFPQLPREMAFRLGAFLRSELKTLGPVLAPEARRSDHPFANVVGTSYVRSFGGATALFPLFIGMGPTMLLLTEDAAALTRRKFLANMARVDASKDTLLVVGGDAFYHHRDLLKTRTHQLDHPTQADFDLMRVVAERHAGILADAKKTLSGRLFLLGSTPTFNPFVDELALKLNDYLRPVCAAHDTELIDCWADLVDPATNHLRVEYSANAYPGDIHYSLATTPIFVEALKARGALPADLPSVADFDWTSVFECEIDPAERTRIWCEPSVSPNNAFKSDKIASSHLTHRLADLLTCLAAHGSGRTIAMVNVRDGAAPVFVPPQVHSGCLALTDSEANRQAGQMVLDFYGRSDVNLELFGEDALDRLDGARFWTLVLMIHPGDEVEDERRCNEVLRRIGPPGMIIVATPDPARVSNLALGDRTVRNTIEISNRHIPEKWRNYALVMLS